MAIATSGLYLLNAIIFNEIHLRAKNERVEFYVILYFVCSRIPYIDLYITVTDKFGLRSPIKYSYSSQTSLAAIGLFLNTPNISHTNTLSLMKITKQSG